MGAEFWSYWVPYQKDLNAALKELRQREFQAGRYYQPPEVEPGFFGSVFRQQHEPSKPKPPSNIREAIKASSPTGTRSILDIKRVAERPNFYTAALLPPEELVRLFGTDKPTHPVIEENEELAVGIERGQGECIIAFKDGKPDEIYFAGYSFD